MYIFLNVPEEEREEAIACGAKWDKAWNRFRVNEADECPAVSKWMLEDNENKCSVVKDMLYIVEGVYTCRSCHRPVKVICFLMQDEYIFTRMADGEIECKKGEAPVIRPAFYPMSLYLKEFVEREYNFRVPYDYDENTESGGNCCKYCGVTISDNALTTGENPLFYNYMKEDGMAEKLVLKPFPLQGSVKVVLDRGTKEGLGLCNQDGVILQMMLHSPVIHVSPFTGRPWCSPERG